MDSWIEQVLSGKVEVNLHDLLLQTPNGAVSCTGTGFATWHEEERCRIRAQSDGSAVLFNQMFSGSTPGRLIAETEKLVLTAESQDGWEIKCDPIPVDGYHIDGNSSQVLWDVEVTGISLTKENSRQKSDEGHRVIRCLLGPTPDQWLRPSTIMDDNPVFGGRTTSRDWLQTSCNTGVVTARRRTDRWFEVQIEPADKSLCVRTLTTAIGRAFGFLAGCRVELRAYEDESDEETARRLHIWDRGKRSNRLNRPLGFGIALLQNFESVLGKLIDFFLTDDGETAAHYLELCWDTTDNWFETRITVATTCVEGLQKLVDARRIASSADDFSSDLATCRSWRRKIGKRFSQRFRDRLNGFLSQINRRSAPDIFREWQSGGFLDVSKEDFEAWKSLRNPAAHGARAENVNNGEAFQDRLDKFVRVVNLINRMVLHLTGYQGSYVDYAQTGWPETAFPFQDTSSASHDAS